MEWVSPVHPESQLARLRTRPDPRRRQERRYPLPTRVGLLLLAGISGGGTLCWLAQSTAPIVLVYLRSAVFWLVDTGRIRTASDEGVRRLLVSQ